jgi:transmembrane sensor
MSKENLPEMLERATGERQKATITLMDGSLVHLNVNSKIRFPVVFASDLRKIELEGEAFFEVARDTLRPFRVYTGRIVTTALGTSFNVNAYDHNRVNVGLSTGAVMVADSLTKQDMRLNPGEGASFLAEAPVLSKHVVDPEKISLWKDGILHFEKIPFKELVGVLETWYGVEIDIKGVMPDDRCSGTFKKNEFLSNVLRVLSHSIGFSYEINGKEVLIRN